MPNFDYISAQEFRESLEADHKEMLDCAEVFAWKSVQVLAGSIVEALLIDYLSSTTNPQRTAKDPLKMDLTEAIGICRAEGVLTDRTADLCSVIRSYRNLIHPGRLIRQGEASPDKETAEIAQALVSIIAAEIAKFRRAAVGLTAEQVLSKIQRDSNAISILRHLLPEVTEQQRERLLRSVIPPTYMDAIADPDPFDDMADRLKVAHRTVLDASTDETRRLVAADFVEILRNGDGSTVESHGSAFFMPSDLPYVAEQHRDMVKEHLLMRTKGTHTLITLALISGFGGQLDAEDVVPWIDPLIQTINGKSVPLPIRNAAKAYISTELAYTSPDVDSALVKRFDEWIAHYEKGGAEQSAEVVRALKADVESFLAPIA